MKPLNKQKKQKAQVPKRNNVLDKKGNMVMASPATAYGVTCESYFKVSSMKHPRFKQCERVQGQDYIQQVATPSSGDQAGRVLAEIYINPQELGISRLSQLSSLYEKYIMTDFKIKWVPALGTSSNGSLIIAPDRDIQDATPAAGEAGLRQFMSFEGAKAFPVWQPTVIDVPLESPDQAYYTSPNGPEDRLSYQGQIYVATVVPVNVGPAVVIGSIYIEYDILLFVPQLEEFPVYNTSTSTGVVATAADAFLGLAPQSAPSVGQTANLAIAGFRNPGVLSPTTALELTEGLYRLYVNWVQNAAGTVQPGNPVITSKDPAPATAPQPQVRTLTSANSSVTGATALRDYLIDVPKGGAYMTLPLTFATGLGAGAVQGSLLTRLGPYLPTASFNNIFT